MKIIIPMTGYGSRFVAQGYQELKPFIQVFGRRIIDWIVNGMYPNETDFLFVCRKEHLEDAAIGMEQKIREICPTAKIFVVDHWVKKGPVYDVLRADELIDDAQPCIINYCDFYMSWDYASFCRDVAANECDGAVPCYMGFHPNLLPKINLYASCKTDANGYLEEIREKYSFEADKTKAKHSPGVYYFKSGKIMKAYFQKLVASGQAVNGEFYASLPYNFMVQDGLRVWVPTNVDYFCQWGTPEDLREMEWWVSNMISPPNVGASSKTAMQILLPMAGAGQRFADAGYTDHKPAIETTSWKDGRKAPMVVCAVEDLPAVEAGGRNVILIDRTFHKEGGVEALIQQTFPSVRFITVEQLTKGQACTCLLAREQLDPEKPLLIAGCDNGMEIDHEKFERMTKDHDFLVFTYRNNECVTENPNAYGWVYVDENETVTGVSVKKAISDTPKNDNAIVSTFWFKKAKYFLQAADKMIAENDRIHNEFYVDQTIAHLLDMGLWGKVFEIKRYIGWGTPKDYEDYEATVSYWKGFCEREGRFLK